MFQHYQIVYFFHKFVFKDQPPLNYRDFVFNINFGFCPQTASFTRSGEVRGTYYQVLPGDPDTQPGLGSRNKAHKLTFT